MTVLREKLYLYVLPPIDFWIGWTHEREFLDRRDEGCRVQADYAYLKWRAFEAARRTEWDGYVEGPYVSGLPPREDNFPEAELIIGWKHGSNGTVFVGSFIPLPWCEPLHVSKHRIEFVVSP